MLRIAGKPISELSDAELEAELARRRRERGGRAAAMPAGEDGSRMAAAVKRAQVRQWYANLELKPGTSLEKIETRYQELLKKYDPERHASDAEKHRAAMKLVAGLTEAYRGLTEHLREG